MEPNVPLLEATMQYITDHPEKHYQGRWYCGSSACFAGTAWELAGNTHVTFTREKVSQVLGLTDLEGMTLFSGINSRAVLGRMVKDLVNGQGLSEQEKYFAEEPSWNEDLAAEIKATQEAMGLESFEAARDTYSRGRWL